MKKYTSKSILCVSGVFIVIMLYCILSMLTRFSYLDLGYLVVVVVCFISFLRLVEKS